MKKNMSDFPLLGPGRSFSASFVRWPTVVSFLGKRSFATHADAHCFVIVNYSTIILRLSYCVHNEEGVIDCGESESTHPRRVLLPCHTQIPDTKGRGSRISASTRCTMYPAVLSNLSNHKCFTVIPLLCGPCGPRCP